MSIYIIDLHIDISMEALNIFHSECANGMPQPRPPLSIHLSMYSSNYVTTTPTTTVCRSLWPHHVVVYPCALQVALMTWLYILYLRIFIYIYIYMSSRTYQSTTCPPLWSKLAICGASINHKRRNAIVSHLIGHTPPSLLLSSMRVLDT